MATIKDTEKRGQVGASFRGLFYSYEQNGRSYVKAWPKPRVTKATENQKFEKWLFQQACIAMKRMDPHFINYAREWSKGTPMLPRDSLMAAVYGKGPPLFFPDGRRLNNMATAINMSNLLDNVSFEKGDILVRHQNLWQALPLGYPGQILRVAYKGGLPEWGPAPSYGSGWNWSNNANSNIDTGAYKSKGVKFETIVPIILSHLAVYMRKYDGFQYWVQIVKCTWTGEVTELLTEFEIDLTGYGEYIKPLIELPVPLEIPAYTIHAILFQKRGSGSPDRIDMAMPNEVVESFPFVDRNARVWHASAPVAVGNTLSRGDGVPGIAMRWTENW